MHQLLHIVWNPEIEAFSIFGITIRYTPSCLSQG